MGLKSHTAMRVSLLLALPVTIAAKCYLPDGQTLQGPDYVPCDAFNSTDSFCCGANRIANVTANFYPDKCLPNGLCEYGGPGGGLFWREGCSNPDWPSDVCLSNVCSDPSENDSNGNALITPCDGTPTSQTWCCGRNDTSCCGQGPPSEITIKATLVAAAATSSPSSSGSSSVSSSSTSSTSTSTTAPSTSSSTHPSNDNSGLSTGAKAGIGVGIAVGALLFIAGLAFFLLARRRERRLQQSYAMPPTTTSQFQSHFQPPAAADQSTYHSDSVSAERAYAHYAEPLPSELDGSRGQVHELSPSRGEAPQLLGDEGEVGHVIVQDEKR